jgi:hypothetical protein
MAADDTKDNDERIEYELRGKTMDVYMFIIRHGEPVGIREVQRSLGFSSPSVAVHHIDKLVRLGVLERDQYGRFVIAKKVDSGVLGAFVQVGRFALPRLGFYAAFFTTISVEYLFVSLGHLDLYALIGTVGSTAAFWYETLRVWARKPF